MTTVGKWGSFTLREAGGLSEVLRAVEGNLPVMWQPPGRHIYRGQATHLVTQDGAMPGNNDDVRDLFISVIPHGDSPDKWHVCAVIRAYSDGYFIVNPDPV